jgi:hypothetical protein
MNIILESEKQNRFSQSKRGLSILLLVDQIVFYSNTVLGVSSNMTNISVSLSSLSWNFEIAN